jgi:hypothetical protein
MNPKYGFPLRIEEPSERMAANKCRTSKLQKPSKIFLENTNLMYAFAADHIRETFFTNQLGLTRKSAFSESSILLR